MDKSKQREVRYTSQEENSMKSSTRYAAIVLAVVFFVLGIIMKVIYGVAVGLILAIVMCFEKKFSMTERGLEIDYRLIAPLYHEVWNYDQIDSIHRQEMRASSLTALTVMKGLAGKRLLFSAEIADKAVQLALEKNEKIYYEEIK